MSETEPKDPMGFMRWAWPFIVCAFIAVIYHWMIEPYGDWRTTAAAQMRNAESSRLARKNWK